MTWNVFYIRPNKFHYSCTVEEFMVGGLGGARKQGVAVFVFGKSSTLVKNDLDLAVKKLYEVQTEPQKL